MELTPRRPYPTGVVDEECPFLALYLTLMTPDGLQRNDDPVATEVRVAATVLASGLPLGAHKPATEGTPFQVMPPSLKPCRQTTGGRPRVPIR